MQILHDILASRSPYELASLETLKKKKKYSFKASFLSSQPSHPFSIPTILIFLPTIANLSTNSVERTQSSAKRKLNKTKNQPLFIGHNLIL